MCGRTCPRWRWTCRETVLDVISNAATGYRADGFSEVDTVMADGLVVDVGCVMALPGEKLLERLGVQVAPEIEVLRIAVDSDEANLHT